MKGCNTINNIAGWLLLLLLDKQRWWVVLQFFKPFIVNVSYKIKCSFLLNSHLLVRNVQSQFKQKNLHEKFYIFENSKRFFEFRLFFEILRKCFLLCFTCISLHSHLSHEGYYENIHMRVCWCVFVLCEIVHTLS